MVDLPLCRPYFSFRNKNEIYTEKSYKFRDIVDAYKLYVYVKFGDCPNLHIWLAVK